MICHHRQQHGKNLKKRQSNRGIQDLKLMMVVGTMGLEKSVLCEVSK